MKNLLIKKGSLLLLGLLAILHSHAQSGSGSTTTESGFQLTFGTTKQEFAEKIYYGPGIYNIDGTLEIYSKDIWIAPNALFSGAGTIVFYNPGDNPFYTGMADGPTRIDGNNSSPIEVNIQMSNPHNLVLTNIVDPGYGTINPAGALSAALHIGNDLNLAVDNGDVILNGNDLILSYYGGISNYSVKRMVVTGNSIGGHLVKEDASPSFTFPIGISEGDYTPAMITPNTPQTLHASVTNYNGTSATIEAPQEGMYRTWHVYADAPLNANVSLQHNVSTNGSAYNDNLAFITQYQGGNVWSSQPGNGYISAGLHALNNVVVATTSSANGSWLTKTSDAITPLPVKLIDFTAKAEACKVLLHWKTSAEENFDRFDIERGNNGRDYTNIGTVSGNGQGNQYSFTDQYASKGQYQYRLRMVDVDGTYSYSNVRDVTSSCVTRQINVYPNPTQGLVNINGLSGNETIQLFSSIGQLLLQRKAVSTFEQIDLSAFASEIYQIIIIEGSERIATVKVIKNN